MSQNRTFITRRQAADRAGVCIRTIDNWLAKPGGLTPYYKGGEYFVRISQEELDERIAVRRKK